MHRSAAPPRLRLPRTLAYTAIRLAVTGTLACSASSEPSSSTVDASADRSVDASPKPADAAGDTAAPTDAQYSDQYSDACPIGEQIPCVGIDANTSCPGHVCNPNDCPLASGCEPII